MNKYKYNIFGPDCKPQDTKFIQKAPLDPLKPNGEPFVFSFHAKCAPDTPQKLAFKKGDSLFDDGTPNKSKYRIELSVLPHVNVKVMSICDIVFDKKYGQDQKQTMRIGDHVF